jgi:hypothetical protein
MVKMPIAPDLDRCLRIGGHQLLVQHPLPVVGHLHRLLAGQVDLPGLAVGREPASAVLPDERGQPGGELVLEVGDVPTLGLDLLGRLVELVPGRRDLDAGLFEQVRAVVQAEGAGVLGDGVQGVVFPERCLRPRPVEELRLGVLDVGAGDDVDQAVLHPEALVLADALLLLRITTTGRQHHLQHPHAALGQHQEQVAGPAG